MSERAVRLLYAHVAVIGAGPAGIAAATRAAERGERVVILDQGLAPGGQIWRRRIRGPQPADASERAPRRWLARLTRSGARLFGGAAVVDVQRVDNQGFLIAADKGAEPCVVRADRLILATGARERRIPFPGWTLPGVLGAARAQALLKSGASFAGQRVALAGTGPLLLPLAAGFARAGAELVLVAEQTGAWRVARFAAGLWRAPGTLFTAARYRSAFLSTPYETGTWVSRAEGEDRLRAVTVTDGRSSRSIECDLLCTGYGLVPNTELALRTCCAVVDGNVVVDEFQETSVPGLFCAGEPTGIAGVDAALLEGQVAGLAATGGRREARRLFARRDRARMLARELEETFAPRAEVRALAATDMVRPDSRRAVDDEVGRARRSPVAFPAAARAVPRLADAPAYGAALQFLFGWESAALSAPARDRD